MSNTLIKEDDDLKKSKVQKNWVVGPIIEQNNTYSVYFIFYN